MYYDVRNVTGMLTAMIAAMMFGCTERTDLAPVRTGYQNLNEIFPPEAAARAVAKESVPQAPRQETLPVAPAARHSAAAEKKVRSSRRQASTPPANPGFGIRNAESKNKAKPAMMASALKVREKKSPEAGPDKAAHKHPPVDKKGEKKTSGPGTKKDNGPLRFGWPLAGTLLKNYAQTGRKGIKIAGKKGQAVRAAESGKVVYSGQGLIGYGNLLIIKHDDQYLTAYANNSALLAKEGDLVKKGQEIATVGGGASRKAMLHFEIRKQGKSVNPLTLLPKL